MAENVRRGKARGLEAFIRQPGVSEAKQSWSCLRAFTENCFIGHSISNQEYNNVWLLCNTRIKTYFINSPNANTIYIYVFNHIAFMSVKSLFNTYAYFKWKHLTVTHVTVCDHLYKNTYHDYRRSRACHWSYFVTSVHHWTKVLSRWWQQCTILWFSSYLRAFFQC